MKKIIFATFAELLVNLAAGWLAIAVSAPFVPGLTFWVKVSVLLSNLGLSIMCLTIAIWMRRKKK